MSVLDPHVALWSATNTQSANDVAWYRYARQVESLAGMKPNTLSDIDAGTGLTLHGAYQAFKAKTSAEAYVAGAKVTA